MAIQIAYIVAGVLLLLSGRKLYWLFVGIIGFAGGFIAANRLVEGVPETTVMIIAVLAGLVGVAAALLVQRFALSVAGFFAGGYLVSVLFGLLNIEGTVYQALGFIGGGLLGALLINSLFDWALIILSSLVGAYLVSQGLETLVNTQLNLLIVAAIALVGFAIQTGTLRGDQSRRKDES